MEADKEESKDVKDGNEESKSTDDVAAEDKVEDKGPPPEDRVPLAEVAKEDGNACLKAGDFAGAVATYKEGLEQVESLLEKAPPDISEELAARRTTIYIALCLNCAHACLKLENWMEASDHASKVIVLERDNAKALFRRGSACAQIDSESRLEQAREDFTRVAQLDPANREAREQLQKVKERLKDIKQKEKQRLSVAMQGGLYQEQHAKLGKQQAAYDEEVKRRKEAEEDEITYEDWVKKEKDKEEERKKKQKDDLEKQQEEARKERANIALAEHNASRVAEGLPEQTLEEWRAGWKPNAAGQNVVSTDNIDLDEDEKKLLQETKSKGYYHGRLGTVLSNAAPKPQQVDAQEQDTVGVGSEWNQAGTWEEKDMSSWVKDKLTVWLQQAIVSSDQVTLPSGVVMGVTAKVTKVKSLTGDAQIVMVRKKPRHGYNYEADLSFSLNFTSIAPADGTEDSSSANASQSFSGSLALPELLDGVQPEDLKIDARWKKTTPVEPYREAANEWVNKLRENVRSQVAAFREEYQGKK